MKPKLSVRCFSIALVLLLLFSACGGNAIEKKRDSLAKFLSAIHKGNYDTAQDYVTGQNLSLVFTPPPEASPEEKKLYQQLLVLFQDFQYTIDEEPITENPTVFLVTFTSPDLSVLYATAYAQVLAAPDESIPIATQLRTALLEQMQNTDLPTLTLQVPVTVTGSGNTYQAVWSKDLANALLANLDSLLPSSEEEN